MSVSGDLRDERPHLFEGQKQLCFKFRMEFALTDSFIASRYKAREEQLLAEINMLNSGMRTFKENAEDKRRKLETNVMRLEQVCALFAVEST